MHPDWIVPDWPAPERVRSFLTTRNGGTSLGRFCGTQGGGMNLREGEGDDPKAVARNRALLNELLPTEPVWLRQVHGVECVDASQMKSGTAPLAADAAYTREAGVVCAVQSADCMPVLFCDLNASVVAVAHAGWRGLAAGVLEKTVEKMEVAPDRLLVFLGPAIGAGAFEVGDDVLRAFVARASEAESAFRALRPGKWLADLEMLARQRLARMGVASISGGGRCTAQEPEHFYSHRRDGITGRMAALIWLAKSG